MMNLGLKLKTERPPLSSHTVACFFNRAMWFQPNDPLVRMIYATYLSKHGKNDEAIKQLELALELGASGSNFEYNLGLAYFEVGDYEKSLRFAHRAYRGGFNLPGLKGKLVKAGKWQYPVDPPVAASKPVDAETTGSVQPKET